MKPSLAANGPLQRGDRILDKYEVRGLLGKGGHAFVYDCFNAFLAEEVAIKLIPNMGQRGNQLLKRARGEAQVLYRLNHPNVVRVMDGGEFNGMAYIVMEKLNGISLRQMLRARGALPVVEALLIALQVAEALEAAHAMNVIHRDLKPDNVFLLAENHVKVLDFGIAKFLEGGYQTTQKDLIQGTAPYMSPEHAQGHGVTFASDIFQLGTIVYEMIAGVCPCMIGVEEVTLQELVAIQISKLPPRLKLLVRGVPDYVDRLVWRAIAKQAQQRFASMPELTEAIRSALERLGVDLPRERLQRSVAVRKSSSRPPPLEPDLATDSGVVRTTPIALAAPRSASHWNALPRANTDPTPDRPSRSVPSTTRGNLAEQSSPLPEGNRAKARPPAIQKAPGQPAATDQSARGMLTRAVLIGALVAAPVGLILGLARRRYPTPTATTATRAAPSAPRAAASASAPAASAPSTAQPLPKASPSDLVVPPVTGLGTAPPVAPHPALSAPTTTARPAPRAASARAARALEAAAALGTATRSSKPATLPTVRVAPKSIF